MSAASRRKGASAERELLKMLSAELGETFKRNLDQTRDGGGDCIEIEGFCLEVKRRERLSRPSWWAQAVEQAARLGVEPMLFYRRSREPWQALIHTRDGGYREGTFAQAVMVIREKWARLYGIQFTGAPPGMLQDDSRPLSRWLASKPDAMRHAREAAAGIAAQNQTEGNGNDR